MSDMKRAKISGEWTVQEAQLLNWMLGYAAGAMVRDKAVSRERAERAAAIADKVQARTMYIAGEEG